MDKFTALNSEDHVSVSSEFWIPENIGKLKIVKQYGRVVIVRPTRVLSAEYLPLGLINFPISVSYLNVPSI